MADASQGKITEQAILDAIQQIRTIADAYLDIQNDVNQTSRDALDNWVGKGRTAFEVQYKTLIRKIDDFGDTLEDIYKGLVDAAAAYRDVDTELAQSYIKVTESM